MAYVYAINLAIITWYKHINNPLFFSVSGDNYVALNCALLAHCTLLVNCTPIMASTGVNNI